MKSSIKRPPARATANATPFRVAVAAVVALMIIIGACYLTRGGTSDVANLDSRGTAVIAFGDSLTAGYGAQEGQDYPSQVEAIIGHEIVNAGRSGDTTADALRRLDEDVLTRDPRIVIVGLGGNDFLRGEAIARTEENLRTIVRRIQEAGAMVILLGFEFPSLSANYAAMYERVAADEKCLLVDDVIDGIMNDKSLKSDEIHPNAAGYRLMAERIAEPTRELLDAADDAR